jgi:protein transport protein SEC61 subunit gamma and related proteins
MQFSEVGGRLKTFAIEARRVLAITRKPTREEFLTIVKVTGIGIIIIGSIGFLLSMIKNLAF